MPSGDNVKKCTSCGRVGVKKGEDLCHFCKVERDQGPEAAKALRREISRKGGHAVHQGKPTALHDDDLPPLDSHEAAEVWLERLARGVATGRVDQGLAAETRRAVKTWMEAHKGRVVDQVVEELRDDIEQVRRRVEAADDRPWA